MRNEGNKLSAPQLNIFVNGQPRGLERPVTLAELLRQLEMPQRGVAVELNLQIVPRAQHAEHLLADGDRLEIVSFVGGG
jgi:sulfur carrier protein